MKLTPKINKAIQVASSAHLGQIRKGDGTPYITHPFAVAWITAQFTDDEDTICAALLHDVLEDVSADVYSREQMEKDFGANVVEIVEGVSEDKDASISKKDEKKSWKDRKQKYLDNLSNDSQGSLLVCAADKIHNMQATINAFADQGENIWKVFNSSKENKLWFYNKTAEIIESKLTNLIAIELKNVLSEYKSIITSTHDK